MNCECGQNKFTENVRCAGCPPSSGRSFSAVVVVEVKSGDTIPQIPFIPVDRVQSCTGRQFFFWPGCLIVLRVSLYRTRESLAPAIAIFGDGQRISVSFSLVATLGTWWDPDDNNSRFQLSISQTCTDCQCALFSDPSSRCPSLVYTPKC